jgi:hypothetical protein
MSAKFLDKPSETHFERRKKAYKSEAILGNQTIRQSDIQTFGFPKITVSCR